MTSTDNTDKKQGTLAAAVRNVGRGMLVSSLLWGGCQVIDGTYIPHSRDKKVFGMSDDLWFTNPLSCKAYALFRPERDFVAEVNVKVGRGEGKYALTETRVCHDNSGPFFRWGYKVDGDASLALRVDGSTTVIVDDFADGVADKICKGRFDDIKYRAAVEKFRSSGVGEIHRKAYFLEDGRCSSRPRDIGLQPIWQDADLMLERAYDQTADLRDQAAKNYGLIVGIVEKLDEARETLRDLQNDSHTRELLGVKGNDFSRLYQTTQELDYSVHALAHQNPTEAVAGELERVGNKANNLALEVEKAAYER